MVSMDFSCFHSRFFLPAWWVHAYEAIHTAGSGNLDPFRLADLSRMSPACSTTELSGLGVAIAKLQRDILSDKSTVVIESGTHKKFNSLGGRVQSFSFERVLQLIGGIKLLTGVNGTRRMVHALVESELWHQQHDGTVHLEFSLTPIGRWAYLGYGEAYSDLVSQIRNQISFRTILGAQRPLALNQSVWLDLQGWEQILFLRLEKSLQWEQSLVKLDGSFAANFDRLFQGLESFFPTDARMSSFERRLSALRKLGRKLVEHGVIENPDLGDFLALSKESGLDLVWKSVSSQVFDADIDEFEILVGRYFLRSNFAQILPDLVSILCGRNNVTTVLSEVETVWSKLASTGQLPSTVLAVNQGLILMAGPLFVEWYIRMQSGHEVPLPDEMLHTELATLVQDRSPSGIAERFEKFANVLLSRSDLVDHIVRMVGGTLVSRSSQADSGLKRFLWEGPVKPGAPVAALPSGPAFPAAIQRPSVGDSSVRPSVKKEATLELKRIRSEDPTKYLKIKQLYMESLDEKSKKIFHEVQRRLQPRVFDDHIRHSLVKYMVENPERW